jgi:hypothetical protein
MFVEIFVGLKFRRLKRLNQFLRQRFRVPSKAQLRAKVPFLRGPPIAPRLRVMPVK